MYKQSYIPILSKLYSFSCLLSVSLSNVSERTEQMRKFSIVEYQTNFPFCFKMLRNKWMAQSENNIVISAHQIDLLVTVRLHS